MRVLWIGFVGWHGCGGGGAAVPTPLGGTSGTVDAGLADVVEVRSEGSAGAYTFFVSILSDETGCDQYADWWEVVSAEGDLVYRRVLGHSHPTEQPFERSGGPVAIGAEEVVWIRGHANPGGYSGRAMQGSVAEGFTATALDVGFAAELAEASPLPDGCAF